MKKTGSWPVISSKEKGGGKKKIWNVGSQRYLIKGVFKKNNKKKKKKKRVSRPVMEKKKSIRL